MKNRWAVLAALALTLGAAPAFAAEGEEFDPVHHVSDGYYLDFEPLGKVELPRIFLVRRADGSLGVDFFASTRRALLSGLYRLGAGAHGGEEHATAPSSEGTAAGHGGAGAHGGATAQSETAGETAGEHGPAGQLADAPSESHEVTSEDVAAGPIPNLEEALAGATHLDSDLLPADGGSILVDFSITRHLVFLFLAALIVFLIFTTLAGRYKKGVGRETAPRGVFQNLFETLVVFVRDEIAKPNLGPKYEKFLPYLLTAFFFIFTANLIGLFPYGATATSNLMVTAVLATFTFVITQLNGTKDYWTHIFWPPGMHPLIKLILIPVEFVGIFTRPVALAIRLFANMTAGHLVILSLLGLIFAFANIFGEGGGWGVAPVSVLFALFIYVLELLVAFIQAYVFTLLSALFIGMAAEEHHQHDEHYHLGELEGHVANDHGHVTPHLITQAHGHESGPSAVAAPRPVGAH